MVGDFRVVLKYDFLVPCPFAQQADDDDDDDDDGTQS